MHKIALAFVIVIVGFLAFIGWQKNMNSDAITSELQVIPVEHASAILVLGNKVIYTDPVGDVAGFDGKASPNVILLTDIHGDHLDPVALEALSGEDVTLVMPAAVAAGLSENVPGKRVIMNNYETKEVEGLTIEAIPMYNLPDEENKDFHTKGRGNGYVINYGEMRVYVAGDTAGTPEMKALLNIDVAFVPMNLPYTMSVGEAAEAVLAFKPQTVYPYHYRGQAGLADVAKFKSLVNAGNPDIEVVQLDWYPVQ